MACLGQHKGKGQLRTPGVC